MKYIESNPKILGGMPVVAGTRIPIARIVFLLKEGYTIDAIQEDYPYLDKKIIEGAVSQLVKILEKDDASKILQV